MSPIAFVCKSTLAFRQCVHISHQKHYNLRFSVLVGEGGPIRRLDGSHVYVPPKNHPGDARSSPQHFQFLSSPRPVETPPPTPTPPPTLPTPYIGVLRN